jgi:hypothetical protein
MSQNTQTVSECSAQYSKAEPIFTIQLHQEHAFQVPGAYVKNNNNNNNNT